MSCVDKDVEDLRRSDCVASKKSGFKPFVLFAKWSDVTTWPQFGDSTAVNRTVSEKTLITKNDVILALGKTWKKIEAADVGMIKLSSKKNGNAWMTDLKIRLQNSLDSRGWASANTATRFVAIVFETEESDGLLFGHPDGYNIQPKKDGGEADWGEKYEDDKFLDLTLEYKPFLPFQYNGSLTGVATPA